MVEQAIELMMKAKRTWKRYEEAVSEDTQLGQSIEAAMVNLRLLYDSFNRVKENKVDGVVITDEAQSIKIQTNIASEIETYLRIRDKLEKQRLREYTKVTDAIEAVQTKIKTLKNTTFIEKKPSEMSAKEVEFIVTYKYFNSWIQSTQLEEQENLEELATLREVLFE